MILSRRSLVTIASMAGFGKIAGISAAYGNERVFAHATSLFGDIKYPADFKHFDYVNPNAPKGGKIRIYGLGSFDSLNTNTFKGEISGYGAIADEALMASSLDEPATMYGLIASGIWHPDDYSSAVFHLRPEARFHDGKPITPDDVIWSLDALKANSPAQNYYYKNVVKAEQTAEREVTFLFDQKGNRELPHIVGQLSVLPKHWWTGKDAAGKDRNIAETTLEPPLGSGVYRISKVAPGASITVKRVEDYWGKDLPSAIGQNNFDELELIYFKDGNVALEAFKGDQYDYRLESSAKQWATGYDFPAAKDGRVVKEEIKLRQVEGMQSWAFNLRRAKFADKRVRQAFNYMFDFEWSNANLFYGQYTRSRSYFNNSEMEATGLPGPEELALLSEFKGKIPDEVFTAEYANPVNGGAQDRRKNMREAVRLFGEAGWKAGAGNLLRNDKGETLSVELLLYSPLFERIALPYKEELEKVGVAVKVRTADSAEYERRKQTFDYDVIVETFGQSLSPGNEQRNFWGAEAAGRKGSGNLIGIKDPAIDALVEKLIFAKDRKELVAACKALDRVLIWNHFVVPMWYIPFERVARWNRVSHPERMPEYALGFPTIWWWDAEKAAKARA